jgi:iron complex outermembrane receptor protein
MQRTELLRSASLSVCVLLASTATAQEVLPEIDIGGAARAERAAPGLDAETKKLPVYREPTGQTFTSIDVGRFRHTPLFTVTDLLQYSPGMSFKQGNGPRDVTLSIRGSGARVGGSLRNIVLLEDGFSMTQPAGSSRTDSNDPHAYAAVDVYRGPSSSLFGNWANGGAVNFRTYNGADIDGARTGHEFGSFGYINNYVLIGKKSGPFDVFLFGSDVRGDGHILHTRYDTQTINLKATYAPTDADRIVFKGLHNELYANLSARLTLNQYYLNPLQSGCYTTAPGCGQTSVFVNGVSGAKTSVTPQQSGWRRNDRRDLIGLRWEHDFDASTTLRAQVAWDDKDYDQPIGTPVYIGRETAIGGLVDLTHSGSFLGHDIRHHIGFWYNRSDIAQKTGNLLPVGNGAMGAVTNNLATEQFNTGLRGREEYALSEDVTGVLGLGVELSGVSGTSSSIDYATNAYTVVLADRAFWNVAPEAALVYRAAPELQIHTRASSGYGTPNYGQLFVNQQGLNGNNTGLTSQRNTGLDLGFDWTPDPSFKLSLTGFHEWYQNELLSQTPGAGLQSYTYNAPSSVHRGVETLAEWRPFDGARLSANYTYNNQIFTNYVEQRGPLSRFDRSGYKIPGVAPHELTARASYDHDSGDLRGLGAFVEYVYKSSYFIDNGNQLTIPSYGLVNVNVHYDTGEIDGFTKNAVLFFEVRNLFDRTYVASATVISNSVNAAGHQNPGAYLAQNSTSIYAGAPRAFQGGVKFSF